MPFRAKETGMEKVVNIDVAGSSMETTLVTPDGMRPFPAVILCHHREGVDEFTVDAARRLAKGGLLTAVPNFYHRRPRDEGWQISRKTMQDAEVVVDLKATTDFLAGLPDVQADMIGIVGHCMGGRTAFIGAATIANLKAAVILYGGHLFKTEGEGTPPPIELIKDVKAPILGLYGDRDHVIPLDEIKRVMAEIAEARIAHEFHIYENAGHAFQDFSRPDHYRKEAAEDAWARALAFLAEKLGARSDSRSPLAEASRTITTLRRVQ